MSTQSRHGYLSSAPICADAVAAPAKPGWQRAIERIHDRLRRRRQLQELVGLDDRLLADVGITRDQAFSAARTAKGGLLFNAERATQGTSLATSP